MKGVLILALIVGLAYAAYPPLTGFYNGKPLRYLMDTIYQVNNTCNQDVQQYNFTQIVDHFADPQDNRTWDQRVLFNDLYFNDTKDSPVIFLQIGGESEASVQWTCWTNYTYINLAVQHSALVIQLEHRFFGYSYPIWENGKASMSTESLKLLTSQQALADLANFIITYNEEHEYINPRWVVFGGSYPGSLCAWFRAQYPNLSVGGICSSAPLWAKVDFYEYAQVMEYAINDYSPVCKEAIRTGFSIAKEFVYTDDGRDTLNDVFNINPPLNPANSTNFDLDATNFMATLFSSFQGIIQYTFDGRNNNTINGYGLTGLCERVLGELNITANGTVDLNYNGTLTNETRPYLELIAEVVFWAADIETNNPNRTVSNNYQDALGGLTRTTFDVNNDDDRDISAGRGWMWLSCGMALGWLQTTEGGEGMFGQALPLNYYLNMCYDLFGEPVNTTYITRKVEESAAIFKNPWTYSASNVVLPNGGYDPWSALGSNVTNKTTHQIAITTPASAHCSDMYPARDGEPVGLNHTRTIIGQEVAYYLSQTVNPVTVPSTTPKGGTSSTVSITFALALTAVVAFL